jgi:negative regulator of sigma-B (phosphoserine phosphatase)
MIEWGVATLALEGEAESGDAHLVKPIPDGVLVAGVDGLGHGPEAAAAAQAAIGILDRYAHEPLLLLVGRCHEGLRDTRGVVMSLASFHRFDGTMRWLAVGNVDGRLLPADANALPRSKALLLRSGVVGYQLPPLRESHLPVTPGDMLILATDGIRSDFSQGLILGDPRAADPGVDDGRPPAGRTPPQQIADRILAEYRKATDDALVLVVRYLGGAS